ncbi:MAG: N-acetyl-gamma-glutamyl-phosphate reductase [Gemmatimonadetes bacterium]|nr:N-acetyl-gamma-glutamyl-phosphate reductase [Gemmatimonadota bacterium]MYD27235.1 N-acetyl-gamma-glutamyl-phosphate reductase [Gemmatimonadota bacterium]MYI98039.1 N-acetyl-gamma-glutamyl-phosphate reductase [Gemmatimonadota bacterium]
MIRLGIVGATGYTGMELYRLASRHPDIEIAFATSEQYTGQKLGEVFPRVDPDRDITLRSLDDIVEEPADLVCFCTPDGVAMDRVGAFLDRGVRVVDVSSDFRFDDPEVYTSWYDRPHTAPSLLDAAVYGIPELNRDRIRTADLVGNPGCYPTGVILGLAPLLEEDAIDAGQIIVDAKSGVSGAGRGLKLRNLYVEVNDSITPYNIGHSHRHVGEIEQELSRYSDGRSYVVFSPHLTPMSRGILATTYVRVKNGATHEDLAALYEQRYEGEPFIRLSQSGYPETRFVTWTNYCDLRIDRVDGSDLAIVTSAIDNLVKGAAGQALQNVNVMSGLDETTGLI